MDNLIDSLNKNKKGYVFDLRSDKDWHCLWLTKGKNSRCIFAAEYCSMQTAICVLINFFGI